jgi:two-component system cell cycle sensor histidine kinase/response regulator CckA
MELGPDAIRSITHDMRNLLTAVRGHAELALRGMPSEDPAREDVAHVVVVTAAVFDLIDQLDGTDTSNTLIAVNLDRSVGAMRRLLDALLPNSIEMNLAPDSDGAYVTISKLRVERIVLNLALNARDAMDDGGVLEVRTAQTDDGQVQIIVTDTGPGFSDEALEHLFEFGFTTKSERGGSGHGLSALARFVDGAGGSIDVDSIAGEGSAITVTLPTADLDDDDAEIGPAEPATAAENADAGAGEDADPDVDDSADPDVDDSADLDDLAEPDEPATTAAST